MCTFSSISVFTDVRCHRICNFEAEFRRFHFWMFAILRNVRLFLVNCSLFTGDAKVQDNLTLIRNSNFEKCHILGTSFLFQNLKSPRSITLRQIWVENESLLRKIVSFVLIFVSVSRKNLAETMEASSKILWRKHWKVLDQVCDLQLKVLNISWEWLIVVTRRL